MTLSLVRGLLAGLIVVLLSACGGNAGTEAGADAAKPDDAKVDPDKTLFGRMAPLCDRAFPGTVEVNEPADADPVYQQSPVLHVRCLGPYKILGLSFGDDRSQSIVLSLDARGVQGLRHLHNNEDGSRRELTEYGGYANRLRSTPERVEFPATAESAEKFRNLGLESRADTVWALALEDGDKRLVYDAKSGGWHLRLAFDLGASVPPPPLPWVEAPVL